MVAFPAPLHPGRLVQRYKRFLADIVFEDDADASPDHVTTVHCPNPGAMMGLKRSGARVFCSRSPSKTRKLPLTLELVAADGVLVGINTLWPNRLAEEAVAAGLVPGLDGLGPPRREVRYGRNSRIDLLYADHAGRPVYVEVKNVHLMREAGLAEFPDCVTARGAKHLHELAARVEAGERAVMLYVVQRPDCDRLAFAGDLDPAYAQAFAAARRAGVEAYAVRCETGLTAIEPAEPIRIFEPQSTR